LLEVTFEYAGENVNDIPQQFDSQSFQNYKNSVLILDQFMNFSKMEFSLLTKRELIQFPTIGNGCKGALPACAFLLTL
jgi:hypothetical protein